MTATLERTTTTLAAAPKQAISTRPEQLQGMLTAAKREREIIGKFIADMMVEDVDFGTLPGTKNRALYRPGAEKLADFFRCTPQYEIVQRVEDFEQGLFHYLFRCQMFQRDSQCIVAEGFGSCSSRESKYRYRDNQRLCPDCKGAFIIKGKAEYGGGWLCFQKKGGCGAKFHDGHEDIVSQQMGRVENQDIADVANTILKMAQKRSLVSAALSMSRCSDFLDGESEDMVQVVDSKTGEVTTEGSIAVYEKKIADAATLKELWILGDEIKKLSPASQNATRAKFLEKRMKLEAEHNAKLSPASVAPAGGQSKPASTAGASGASDYSPDEIKNAKEAARAAT
jgi:hypothetical protein